MAVALVVRLACVAATPAYAPSGDPADYDRHAISLSQTGAFAPTAQAEPGGASALRPPLYPLVLAGTYEATGARWTPARLLGVLLGTLAVGLLFLLADVVFGRSIAKWTGGLAAMYPPLTWLPAGLSAENLFIPLALAALLALVRLRATGSLRWAAGAGLLIGLAALTRSNGLVLLVPALLAIFAGRDGAARTLRERRLPAAGALLAALVVTLVPWTVRNASEFGRLLPLGTQSGYTIAGQYNPVAAQRDDFEAMWRVPETVPHFEGLFRRPGVDEADLDAQLRSLGFDYALDHPGYVLRVVVLNAQRMFDLGPNFAFSRTVSYDEMGIPRPQHGQVSGWVRLVLLLAIAGAIVLWRRRRLGPLWLWSAPLLLFASVVGLLAAPRYRTPVDPFLLLLAGAALSATWGRIRHRRAPAAA